MAFGASGHRGSSLDGTFTEAHLHSYSQVEDSVLMQHVDVGRGAVVRRAILDENVRVAPGARIGVDADADPDRFTVSPGGIVVVGKGAVVEA